MTAQIADTITIDGVEHMLFSEPLDAYYAQPSSSPRPHFVPENTANWRGYVAGWEIRDGKLYLTALHATVCDDPVPFAVDCQSPHPVELKDLFDASDNGLFASWFSGTLRVPLGAQIGYVHMGYESVYEFDLFLHIENGVVTSTSTIDNRGRP